MLKITVCDKTDGLCLKVEGRLAGDWVSELEQCWHAAKAHQPERRFSVDLRGVTFIDRSGYQLLQAMHRGGVSFEACRLMVQDILGERTGSAG